MAASAIFLERLPRELRDNIYSFSLGPPITINIFANEDVSKIWLLPRKSTAAAFATFSALTKTNKHLYGEVRDYFFSTNKFIIAQRPDKIISNDVFTLTKLSYASHIDDYFAELVRSTDVAKVEFVIDTIAPACRFPTSLVADMRRIIVRLDRRRIEYETNGHSRLVASSVDIKRHDDGRIFVDWESSPHLLPIARQSRGASSSPGPEEEQVPFDNFCDTTLQELLVVIKNWGWNAETLDAVVQVLASMGLTMPPCRVEINASQGGSDGYSLMAAKDGGSNRRRAGGLEACDSGVRRAVRAMVERLAFG